MQSQNLISTSRFSGNRILRIEVLIYFIIFSFVTSFAMGSCKQIESESQCQDFLLGFFKLLENMSL